MLNNLSEQVRQCHSHAEHCAQQAGVQTDQKLFGNGTALADVGPQLRVHRTTGGLL
jgi:hypothetical protein